MLLGKQAGDRVIYFPQAHILYIEAFPGIPHGPAPWDIIPSLRNEEECEVLKVEYRPSCHGIYALLTLKLVHLMNGEQVFEDMLEEFSQDNIFTVCYHPDNEITDFLLLKKRYEIAMKINWKEEHKRVEVFFEEELSGRKPKEQEEPSTKGRWYGGTVLSCTPADPEKFPDSYWECVEVRWDSKNEDEEVNEEEHEGGEDIRSKEDDISRVSPWEVRECIEALEDDDHSDEEQDHPEKLGKQGKGLECFI